MQIGIGSVLHCVHLSPHVLSVLAKRFMPARGTKPLPRYLWDMEDLIRQTKGKYTHEPLVLRRLGGRDPQTGLALALHIIIYRLHSLHFKLNSLHHTELN